MKKWLDDNDILPHLTHNEGKSIVAERFIKTLKAKICKKLTANDSKSYLGYLNKLADEYNNSYYRSIGKKTIVVITLLWLKIVTQVIKHLNLKLVIESELLSIWTYLAKVTPTTGE